MTALAQEKARYTVPWKYKQFTLTGVKAYKGADIFLILTGASKGKCTIGAGGSGLRKVGIAAETVDATSADLPLTVDLEREIWVEYYVNATAGDACAATDIGSMGYAVDDQTVSVVPAGRSPIGTIWDVDALKGVGIEKQYEMARPLSTPVAAFLGAYAANDLAPAANLLEHDGVYDVPTTGAASTITLPAGAPDGTRVTFCADGTKNGNTVQYRDATGPTNLTTALTGSKRHEVVCVKRGGNWFANAYVSP